MAERIPTKIRKRTGAPTSTPDGFPLAVCVALLAALLGGCHEQNAAAAPEAKSAASENTKDEGETQKAGGDKHAVVSLTSAQIQKLELATETASSDKHGAETPGFGVVMPHEPIAIAVAELEAAQATMHQARSALARQQRLIGTPGAVSADLLDASIQQEAVDAAQLHLSQRRLTTLLGDQPPWSDSDHDVWERLATGKTKLLRLTFPRDVTSNKMPWQIRVARIGASSPANSWRSTKVWGAPADATVPGRSLFALLDGSYAAEGERLQVWASNGVAEEGVVVPVAAVLLHEGKYWCYLEKEAGKFSRTEVDIAEPTAGGYFVTSGIVMGDKIVISDIMELLAQETNTGGEAD